MVDRSRRRLRDIIDAIDQIDRLMDAVDLAGLRRDRVKQAAFERFLEIVSEASRHIPETMTGTRPDVPWHRIRALGNQLRHAYDKVDLEILWRIHAYGELATLRDAAESFLLGIDSGGAGQGA